MMGDIARSAILTVTILAILFIAAVLLFGCSPMMDRLTVPQDERPAKCKECR